MKKGERSGGGPKMSKPFSRAAWMAWRMLKTKHWGNKVHASLLKEMK